MTLPLYILRRQVLPGGKRLRKRPVPEPDFAGWCPECGTEVYNKMIMAQKQVDGMNFEGHYYHYECHRKVLDRRAKQTSDFRKMATSDLAWKGNLGEEEYRFWIGHRNPVSFFAMCRCCRKSIYSTDSGLRKSHFKDEHYVVGGDGCARRLTDAFKEINKTAPDNCIVCHTKFYGHGKWGIPICASPVCLNTWKFDMDKNYPMLEVRLRQQVARADILRRKMQEDADKLVLIKTNPARKYCDMCKLFEDNEAHEETHKAFLKMFQEGLKEDHDRLETAIGEGLILDPKWIGEA